MHEKTEKAKPKGKGKSVKPKPAKKKEGVDDLAKLLRAVTKLVIPLVPLVISMINKNKGC